MADGSSRSRCSAAMPCSSASWRAAVGSAGLALVPASARRPGGRDPGRRRAGAAPRSIWCGASGRCGPAVPRCSSATAAASRRPRRWPAAHAAWCPGRSSAASLRAALEAAGCFDTRVLASRPTRLGGPIVAARRRRRLRHHDLRRGDRGGDGRAVAARPRPRGRRRRGRRGGGRAGRRRHARAGARTRASTRRELAAQLAEGPACRVLPAPALPEQADLIDEGGVAQVLDAGAAAGLRARRRRRTADRRRDACRRSSGPPRSRS